MPDPARILIVDTPAAAGRLARVLDEAGHDARTAGDWDGAMARLDATGGGYDVIVIDFNQPPGAALAAMRALRERHRGVLPIVTTAWAQPTTAVAMLKLGAVDYLVKPVADKALLSAVDAAAARRVLLGETASDPAVEGPEQPTPNGTANPGASSTHTLPTAAGTLAEALAEAERAVLLAALEDLAWSRGQTAARLGIDRTTLYKKIRRYGLDRPDAARGR